MRLIDGDAYAAEMRKRQENCRAWKDRWDEGTELYALAEQSFMTFVEAALTLKNQPTVDAIPVEYLMKYAQLPTEFAIAAWRKQDKYAQEKQIKRLDKPMSLDDALNLVNEVFPLGQKEQEAR